MWKAVCRKKSGAGLKETRPVTVTGSRWQRLASRMEADIISGRFRPGEALPSAKECQALYGVSFPTLKKALVRLSGEDLIRSGKQGYLIPLLTATDTTARIAVLGCGWEDGTLWVDYQDKNYFRLLESACIQARIALDIVVYYRKNGRIHLVHSATGKPYGLFRDAVLGIACIVANLSLDPGEVLAGLARWKKPVAILDVVGGWRLPAPDRSHAAVQFFTNTASRQPGRSMARYLLELGHKKMAFFSPFHQAAWSQQRLEGIAQIYQAGGGVVRPFVLDQYAYPWDFITAEGAPEGVQSFYREHKHLTDWNCANREVLSRMTPLFRRALGDKTITAWLMANDYTAILALDYLKEKKIQIPQQLSVAAFDNTLDAMEYQLTSYDFNSPGLVQAMLRHILDPGMIPAGRRGTVIEAEGSIVVRRTVGENTPPILPGGKALGLRDQ
jgi:hypothetical protein